MLQHGMELADVMVEPVSRSESLATCLTVVLVLSGEMDVLHVLPVKKQLRFQLRSFFTGEKQGISGCINIYGNLNPIC